MDSEIIGCLVDKSNSDHCKKIFLRASIKAELGAVDLYESIAKATADKSLHKTMLSVAREEKTHIGEFQHLLLKYDPEQGIELKKGAKEVSKEK